MSGTMRYLVEVRKAEKDEWFLDAFAEERQTVWRTVSPVPVIVGRLWFGERGELDLGLVADQPGAEATP